MKFRIEAITLSDKLGLLQGISERRATMPILSHVLISAASGKVKLTATDLETTMITWCDADVKKEGSIALPARKTYEIVKEIPLGDIEIEEIGNHWAELKSKSATFKIAGLPSEDFPVVQEASSQELFSIESAELDEMITKTIFAVSPDDMRRNLSGIYFEKIGKQDLRLVATDGHRLSLVEKHTKSEVKIKKSVLIPKKGVSELRKVLKLSDGVRIGFGKSDFIAEGNGFTLIVRLIDAEFPNYKQVIPETTHRSMEVKRDDFLSALKRVSVISSERTKSVKMSLDKEGMILMSVSPELGEAREVVPVEFKGDSIELGFNARYLMDILEVINSEVVQVAIGDELSPVIVKPMGEEVYISVVMPMRV
ncbi:MAG: DNA polymerase III subunit beta [Candidatus Dadabacteria bacterium]|nr:DNA polymerase III subunit beta [Candidatus Dadabacteria bacterium]